jgi:3-hydroxybutyryl-CoA dehydratase
LTGDLNPAHIDEEYAKKTFFKTRIVHGMLLGGLISGVLGNKLPGPGTIYLSQHLDFLAPVRIGDTITASVEISEVMAAEKKVRIKTTCVNQEGKKVLDGEAVVSPPKAPKF